MDEGVRQAAAELADALGRGDAPAAAALYADDGRLLTPAAELIAGRGQIEAYWGAGIAFGLSRLDLDPVEVRIGGCFAIEIGRYALSLAAVVADRGKYLVLHRRQADGTWRRAVDVFNPDVPEAARHLLEEER